MPVSSLSDINSDFGLIKTGAEYGATTSQEEETFKEIKGNDVPEKEYEVCFVKN